MRRTKSFFLSLAAAAAILASCQKTDSPANGDSELGVQLRAVNPSFALKSGFTKSAAIESDSISWDTAQLIVSSIKFEAELKSLTTGRDSIEIEYKWHGPEWVDLLDSGLTLGNFVLAPGTYDEIELTVSGDAEDAGDEPVFFLSGTYKSPGGSWPIVVKVTRDVRFKTEKENVEITEEGVDVTSVIKLYLDELMNDVDPSDLDNARLTDGVILISAERNPEIYHTIFGNLQRDCRTEYWHKEHGEKHWHKKNKHDDDDDEDD